VNTHIKKKTLEFLCKFPLTNWALSFVKLFQLFKCLLQISMRKWE